jgi:hypothetical protein
MLDAAAGARVWSAAAAGSGPSLDLILLHHLRRPKAQPGRAATLTDWWVLGDSYTGDFPKQKKEKKKNQHFFCVRLSLETFLNFCNFSMQA